MKYLRLIPVLAAIVLVAPISVVGQVSTNTGLALDIPGFGEVAADVEGIEVSAPFTEANSLLVYETNRAHQTVFIHVDGDLTGLEVRVDPDIGSQRVLGRAATGSIGETGEAVFRAPGAMPLVTDVSGAGVEMGVRYSIVALDPGAAGRIRDIRIYYTIN